MKIYYCPLHSRKNNTISNVFYYVHFIEIPTQNGEHSLKCTELSLKRKEGTFYIQIKAFIIFWRPHKVTHHDKVTHYIL